MKLINNLKFAWQYAKDEKFRIGVFLLCNIISIVLYVVTPILSAKIIIELTSNNYIRLISIAVIILLIEIISEFIGYTSRRCSITVYRNTLSKLEADLGRNILKLENECLDKNGSGLFIQRLTNDTSRMADVFNALLDMVTTIIQYIGVLVAIFIVNKIIFIYVVVMLILLYLLERKRTNKRNEDDKIYRKSGERVASFIGELVRGARDIKMLNSEDSFINELILRVNDANDKRMKMQKTTWLYKLVMYIITDLKDFTLIVLLVLLMEKKVIVAATALILYNYAGRLSRSVRSLGGLLEYIKDFNLSSDRIRDIIYSDEFKKEKFGTEHLDKVNGDFEFKNVTFAYNKKKVLDNLNFNIKANTTTAFVGKSGAGKTTIFNLLCKMYDIKKGEITIDGINIRHLDRDSIRGNITVISQNPYIFNMSIKDNLKIVKEGLTDIEMKKACKMACLDDFIKTLPDGYDTIIGEGGVNLSGGQKQRLAIARALVQKTEIILFDEATSALDNETQEKIQKAIENMKNEYTILIIAHRLSTVINADKIMLLDNGKIINEGTHEYLLKNSKEYQKLYETELSNSEE